MSFAPDFGLHFQKTMGKDAIFDWAETEIYRIDRMSAEHYTFSCNIKQGDIYAATFDFGKLQAEQLIQSAIPPAKEWLIAFFGQEFKNPTSLDLFKFPVHVGLQAHLGELIRLEKEDFIPFVVAEFYPAVMQSLNLEAIPEKITHAIFDGENLTGLAVEYIYEGEETEEKMEGYLSAYVCYPQMYDQCEYGSVLLKESIEEARKSVTWITTGSVQFAIKLDDLTDEQYFNARVLFTQFAEEFRMGFGGCQILI